MLLLPLLSDGSFHGVNWYVNFGVLLNEPVGLAVLFCLREYLSAFVRMKKMLDDAKVFCSHNLFRKVS